MQVRVKVFGPQAQLIGKRECVVTVPETATAAELRNQLARAEPALAASLIHSRFAFNHEFVGDEARVGEHDEVALLGMMSGG